MWTHVKTQLHVTKTPRCRAFRKIWRYSSNQPLAYLTHTSTSSALLALPLHGKGEAFSSTGSMRQLTLRKCKAASPRMQHASYRTYCRNADPDGFAVSWTGLIIQSLKNCQCRQQTPFVPNECRPSVLNYKINVESGYLRRRWSVVVSTMGEWLIFGRHFVALIANVYFPRDHIDVLSSESSYASTGASVPYIFNCHKPLLILHRPIFFVHDEYWGIWYLCVLRHLSLMASIQNSLVPDLLYIILIPSSLPISRIQHRFNNIGISRSTVLL